jgi:putative acetyltransferase
MDIEIRHAEEDDAEALSRIYGQPRVVSGTMQLPYPSTRHWRERLQEPPPGMFNLVACVEGEVTGHLALHTFPNSPRRRHMGSIGMGVHDAWQGKGVGTALMEAAVELADRWLNLLRLDLEVYTDNEPAVRLYEKFGFEVEGTLRCYSFRDGEYVDAYKMARLRARP